MNLTYLYVRHRSFRLEQLQTDGHYALMQNLVARGLVDSVKIVMENYAQNEQVNVLKADPKFRVESHKNISTVMTAPGDVIWVRGGWKPWIPWIEERQTTNWFMYYGANAGHNSWPWWDVILNDLQEGYSPSKYGRLVWHYRKPVSPEFMNLNIAPKYDVIVGASHIYDRKGQYRILPIAKKFKKITGRDLRVVMPGCWYSREKKTEAMKAEMREGKWPNIHMPGWLPRAKMVEVYNSAPVFYAATCGGQGDRCVMESGTCGCRQIIGTSKPHAPYTYRRPDFAFVPSHEDAFDEIAEYLASPSVTERDEVAGYFRRNGGQEAAMATLKPLLYHFKRPKDRETLKELI
jgi:hypothetical protein